MNKQVATFQQDVKIQVIVHNVGGMRTKLNNFNNFLAKTDFDLVVIQETWLSEDIDNDEIVGGTEFEIMRSDRKNFIAKKKTGGGILMCCRNNIVFEELKLSEKQDLKFRE